jgi:hypothetical protein
MGPSFDIAANYMREHTRLKVDRLVLKTMVSTSGLPLI